MKFDAVVVGAGPSGSTTAKNLASKGIKVLLVDKEKFPRKKPCGGGLPLRTLERFPFIKDMNVIESYSYGGYVHSPSLKNTIEIKKQEPVIAMVQRDKFDQSLVDLAVDRGTLFMDNKVVKDIDIKLYNARVSFLDGTSVITDLVIGADGFRSIVANKTGLSRNKPFFGICILEEFPLQSEIIRNLYTANHFCHIFSKFHGIMGYGWVFPKKKYVNVGLVTYKIKKTERYKKLNLKRIFYEYLSFLQKTHVLPSSLKSTKMQAGLLPVQPLHKTYTDRVLLCGDAAGLINPISGEGIYYALVSGDIAGKVAVNAIKSQDTSERFLSRYQKEWNQDFGKEIKLLLKTKDQWGKEGERVVELMKNDKKFAELIFTIMMGKESAYDLRWKLIKRYLYTKIHTAR